MTKITGITYDQADEPQRELWDSLVGSRGGALNLVGPDGALVGPFNAMVTSPGIGARMAELGAAIRFGNSVESRLLELAITTVGAYWKAEFEFWAHGRLALEAGIDQSVVDALAAGTAPRFDKPDEAVVHRFASSMVATGRVDDETFAATRDLLGEQGVVDLLAAVGYYCLISFTLNALDVPLPAGVDPVWGD